jgi:hypothetical protein
MRSAFFRDERIGGLADVNDTGTAAGLTARDQSYSGRSDTPIVSGLAALSSPPGILGGGRTVDLSAVQITSQVPAKRERGRNDSN